MKSLINHIINHLRRNSKQVVPALTWSIIGGEFVEFTEEELEWRAETRRTRKLRFATKGAVNE